MESVARKNAALQRIIKAILAKLREEGTEAAALAVVAAGGGPTGAASHRSSAPAAFAAAAASCDGCGGGPLGPGAVAEERRGREGQGAGGPLGLPSLADLSSADHAAMAAPAAAAAGEGASFQREVTGDAGVRGPWQRDAAAAGAPAGGGGGRGDRGDSRPSSERGPAGRVVSELAERVALLQDELEATRQALAAAAGLVVAAPAAAGGADGGGRAAKQAGRTAAAAAGARAASPSKRLAASPQRQQQVQSGRGVSPALEDGVAAFVLFAVQRLRHTPLQQQHQSDALPSANGGAEGGDLMEGSGEEGAGYCGQPQQAGAEQLAQMLLDLLHAYEPEQTADFTGMSKPPSAAGAHQLPPGTDGAVQVERSGGRLQSPEAAAGDGGKQARLAGASGEALSGVQQLRRCLAQPPAEPSAIPGVDQLLAAVAAEEKAKGGRTTFAPALLPKRGGGARTPL